MTDTLARTPAAGPRIPSPRTQTIAIVTAGAGQNIIYTVVTTFMLLYLLQYADFNPAQIAIATTVIAVTRIVDAIGDPIVGSLIDMTRTRWGKLRPFVLFSALPVAVLTALLFAVPEGAVLYFAVIYVIWGFAYTFCDVPLWGLIGSAFPEPGRRNRVVGFVRAFGAISLGAATLGLTPARQRAQLRSRDHRRRLVPSGRAGDDSRHGCLPACVLLRPRARQRRPRRSA